MKLNIILILLIICPIFSNGKGEVVKIDMQQYKTVEFDSLVKEISCIKLETGNKSAFDYCTKIIRYEDYFYLMVRNISGSKVIIYTTSGSFVKEITFSDGLMLNTLVIVPGKEQLWVVSRNRVLNKFKLDGTALGRVALPFPCVSLFAVNNHDFLIYDGGGYKDIEGHYMALTDFKVIHKLFLPRTDRDKDYTTPQNMFAPDVNDQNIFILPDKNDTIYYYDSKRQEVVPFYHLDFHGNYLIRKMYPFKGFSDEAMHEIITKRKYIYAQYCFFQVADKLLLKLTGKRDDFCMINLRDHSLLSFSRLFNGFEPTSYNPVIGSDGINLYFATKETDLVKHYQKNKCTYPAIQKLLPSLSANGNNWILLKMEIKL